MQDLSRLISVKLTEYEISRGDTIVCACSGGIDSMVLLTLLNDAKKNIGFKLCAAHVNHMLRARESLRDENFVLSACSLLNIHCEVSRAQVKRYCGKHHLSVEDGAREIRYSRLAASARKLGAKAVFLAHHADDAAETVFINLIRGAGLNGLALMSERLHIFKTSFFRPILNISRSRIELFAAQRSINYVQDSSNSDTRFLRNFVRMELFPLILKKTGRNAARAALSTAVEAKQALEIVSAASEIHEKNCVEARSSMALVMKLKSLKETPGILREEIIKKFIPYASKSSLAAANDFIDSKKHSPGTHEKHVFSNAEYSIIGTEKRLVIVNKKHLKPISRQLHLKLSEQRKKKVAHGDFQWRFSVIKAPSPADCRNLPTSSVWDYGNAGKPVELNEYIAFPSCSRTAIIQASKAPAYRPIGSKSVKTASRIMSDNKVPMSMREYVPALCIDKKCAWIPGCRISEDFKIKDETEYAIHVKLTIRLFT